MSTKLRGTKRVRFNANLDYLDDQRIRRQAKVRRLSLADTLRTGISLLEAQDIPNMDIAITRYGSRIRASAAVGPVMFTLADATLEEGQTVVIGWESIQKAYEHAKRDREEHENGDGV